MTHYRFMGSTRERREPGLKARATRELRQLDGVVAGALLVFVLMANVYRAVTQSIVYDEAASYLNFIHDSVLTPLTDFNAANHVLFSVLAAISTHALGPSEFTVRLPSVLGAAGYLAVVYALARLLCGRGVAFVATVAALSLNPLVFDFMSAARGYGLALFWLCLGLLAILYQLTSPAYRRRLVIAASIAFGLAVCSNLAFLFPVAGSVAAVVLVMAIDRSFRRDAGRLVVQLTVPGAVVCAAILAAPMRHVRRDLFYFGADSLVDTAASLVAMTLSHHPTPWTATRAAALLTRGTLFFAVALVIVAMGRAAAIALRARHADALPQSSRIVMLLGIAWAATLGLLALAHVVAGLPYPLERTGLYFIPLFIVTMVVTAGDSFRLKPEATRAAAPEATRDSTWLPPSGGSALATIALVIATVLAIEQFTLSSYATWRFDAGSRDVAAFMASWPINRPLNVATSQWLYQPALEYYRVVRFPDRFSPIAEEFDAAQIDRYDFLVVNDEDNAAIDPGWRRVYTHPVSGAHVLANPHLSGP